MPGLQVLVLAAPQHVRLLKLQRLSQGHGGFLQLADGMAGTHRGRVHGHRMLHAGPLQLDAQADDGLAQLGLHARGLARRLTPLLLRVMLGLLQERAQPQHRLPQLGISKRKASDRDLPSLASSMPTPGVLRQSVSCFRDERQPAHAITAGGGEQGRRPLHRSVDRSVRPLAHPPCRQPENQTAQRTSTSRYTTGTRKGSAL